MTRTKKVASAGRFGVRYGKRIRQRVIDIEKRQRKPQKCPACHKTKVKRIAAGIWQCKRCNLKFAGKAYEV